VKAFELTHHDIDDRENLNSGGRGFGKLWTVAKMQNLRVTVETFEPDDPDYNPNDTALLEIHCSVKPAPRPPGSG